MGKWRREMVVVWGKWRREIIRMLPAASHEWNGEKSDT